MTTMTDEAKPCADFRVTRRWANQHVRKLEGTFTGTGKDMLLPLELMTYDRMTIYPETEPHPKRRRRG